MQKSLKSNNFTASPISHAKGQRVGYVRVSGADQNEERQLLDVEVDRTFIDKASGRNMERPQLEAMLGYVRLGDTIVCHNIDRFARSLVELLTMVRDLTKRGVRVEFLKESLSFSGDDSPMSTLMLAMLGAFAQFELDRIRDRQREGIDLARKAGTYIGRRKSLTLAEVAELRARIAARESKAELARELGVSRRTIYNYMALPGGEESKDESSLQHD